MKNIILITIGLFISFQSEALIKYGIFTPGTYGGNPPGASMEIAINPNSTYAFPPAASEFNLILYAPTADFSGSESFSIVENNINNGSMSWDSGQTFDHNGNRYFVFTYSGTGINLSVYGSGSFVLAFTIGVTGGSGFTNFSIADENADLFIDFGIRSALNLVGSNELETTANPVTLNSVALPLELIDFSAYAKDRSIDLVWKTQNELDFTGFELERATEINNFVSIAWIAGAGGEREQGYTFEDKEVTAGQLYYYRLKMIDMDGRFNYSNIVSGSIKSLAGEVKIFPNPVIDELNIENPPEGMHTILIRNQQGKVVLIEQSDFQFDDDDSFQLNLKSLQKGVYFIQLLSDVKSTFHKLLKVN